MKFKGRILSFFLAFVLILINITPYNVNATVQKLEVHFIDVGQGDATYIKLPNGDDILIDSGESIYGTTVYDYLNTIEKNMDLEYLIATHPDSDHIGGMQEIFKKMDVKEFYYPMDTSHTSATWNNVLNLAKQEGCNISDAASGISFNIAGVKISFVHPDIDYSNNNDDSVVTLIEYNNNQFLLTGDISSVTENDIINKGLVGDIDVLKVAHHGSKYSSSQAFLDRVNAEYSIISVGKGNSYGHPTSETLNRLQNSGSNILRTDTNGTIKITSDGNNISVYSDADLNSQLENGWVYKNNLWYFYKNGIAQTGWLKDNGTWYYLTSSGAMKTGWLNDNGTWYYLTSSGAMKTGWLNDNGIWYYFTSSGAMKTGWLNDNGIWYYFTSSGAMKTGWLNDNGTWYYLYSSGAMAVNTIIDGWQIDSNGVATPITNTDNSSEKTTVYVTPNGKSYHYTKNCVALKRSSTILSMSLATAKGQGKSDPCNLCTH